VLLVRFTFQDTLCSDGWKYGGAPSLENCDTVMVSPCQIDGGHSGKGTDFSPSTLVFASQYHSTNAPCSFNCIILGSDGILK
jgi:hypothetical protein